MSPDDQTKLMDLDPKHLVTIYKCMIKEQEGKAEQIFQTQFSNPNREEKDADFVKDLVRQTMETMRDKAYTLKAKGGGDIYIESLGNPKYLGSVTPKIIIMLCVGDGAAIPVETRNFLGSLWTALFGGSKPFLRQS